MSKTQTRMEMDKASKRKLQQSRPETGVSEPTAELTRLQGVVGNRALQRLLVQRKANQGFDLDDETALKIESERSGGQPLPKSTQEEMGESLGADFSGVRVHTSSEASELNDRVNAQAFTTGQDVFFREGQYDPQSQAGKQVLAHELTHVVQQASGQVSNSTGVMHVNPAGDSFEHQADQAALKSKPHTAGSDVQRQELEEEDDETVQRVQREEEEERMLMFGNEGPAPGWSVRASEQNYVEDIKPPNWVEDKNEQNWVEDFSGDQSIPQWMPPSYSAPPRQNFNEGYIPLEGSPNILEDPNTGMWTLKEEEP